MQLIHFLFIFKMKKKNRDCTYNIVVTSCFRYEITFYLFYDQVSVIYINVSRWDIISRWTHVRIVDLFSPCAISLLRLGRSCGASEVSLQAIVDESGRVSGSHFGLSKKKIGEK